MGVCGRAQVERKRRSEWLKTFENHEVQDVSAFLMDGS